MNNKQDFLTRLLSVKRTGISELSTWLSEETDFFTAPASVKFHGNLEGGLCAHSLMVCERLIGKTNDPFWGARIGQITGGCIRDTIYIVSLLHDVCKINTYEKYYRNVKIYVDADTPTSRHDSHGIYEWNEVEAYKGNYNQILPHAEQSISLITKFITLTTEEEMAIRYHMGFTEPKEHWQNMNVAMEKYPLVLALQQADMESSHFLETTIV